MTGSNGDLRAWLNAVGKRCCGLFAEDFFAPDEAQWDSIGTKTAREKR